MKRRYRLTRPEDFARVRREGRPWHGTILVLLAALNQRNEVRFGFAVGKRVGKAAVRNRTKRRLREATWSNRNLIPAGHDVVFIARQASGRASFQEINQAVRELLIKAFPPQLPDNRQTLEKKPDANEQVAEFTV